MQTDRDKGRHRTPFLVSFSANASHTTAARLTNPREGVRMSDTPLATGPKQLEFDPPPKNAQRGTTHTRTQRRRHTERHSGK
eukprot:482333-Rhodomonas_salina.1